jgi:phytoene dehydrogenase-like protein
MTHSFFDAAVVGGGLAGLATAGLLARHGASVVVLERASEAGGRAATHVQDGYCFNLGAHALYKGGAAARVLARMGVPWTGGTPTGRGVAELDGRRYTLPATVGSLLTTSLLGWSAKAQGARMFARLGSMDLRPLRGVPLRAWLDAQLPDPTMRATFEAFVRVATYANAPELADTAATIEQLRLAQRPGVAYVDGGWATLVDGALAAARAAGVVVRTSARVACAAPRDGGWSVSLHDDDVTVPCRSLVLATGPANARSIVPSGALAAWADAAVPLRAACLDVALSRLPDPGTTFALGVDRPLYFSVHSGLARVAPDGRVLASTMKYLPPGRPGSAADDEAELDAWLDRLQPGWRDVLLHRRWLPAMVTSNALVRAAAGGTAGRPGPAVPDAPGVYVAGDWIGNEGMLLDAALASAERAADELGGQLPARKVVRAVA